jgi:hypothetical protein
MIEQFRGTVAQRAAVSLRANTLIIELLVTRLGDVKRLTFGRENYAPPITLTVVERATTMIVRR